MEFSLSTPQPLKILILCRCFTALQHILGHFGRGQLTYPHCSWASLLGSLPVLSAHSFASNWQLPFLNQRKGEDGRRNYFMAKNHDRMLPDVRIESTTDRIPDGRSHTRRTRIRSSYHAQLIYRRVSDETNSNCNYLFSLLKPFSCLFIS